MKISIIVPVFNSKNYLMDCIESIIHQTYHNLEIILVDDGSTDGSGEICKEYAEKDQRIKLIQKQNGGASSARNLGIDEATGDYIGFVDSDDWLEKDMYAFLFDLIKHYNTDIAACGYVEQGMNYDLTTHLLSDQEAIQLVFNDITSEIKLGASLCNKLFKSSIIKANRIKLNEDITIGEDLLYLCQCIAQCSRIAYNGTIKYHYSTNLQSVTQKGFKISNLSIFEAHNILLNTLALKYRVLTPLVKSHTVEWSIAFILSIFQSNYNDLKLIKSLQYRVRENLLDFLKSNLIEKRIKFYAILISINPKLFYYIWRYTKKLKGSF